MTSFLTPTRHKSVSTNTHTNLFPPVYFVQGLKFTKMAPFITKLHPLAQPLYLLGIGRTILLTVKIKCIFRKKLIVLKVNGQSNLLRKVSSYKLFKCPQTTVKRLFLNPPEYNCSRPALPPNA